MEYSYACLEVRPGLGPDPFSTPALTEAITSADGKLPSGESQGWPERRESPWAVTLGSWPLHILHIADAQYRLTAQALFKSQLGWKKPGYLRAYSHDSDYPNLYVYFDVADEKSLVNAAATKAFKCYGVDGKPHIMDWIAIRGSCFVLRAEPPSAFRTNPSADGVGTLSYSLPGLPPNALNAHYFPVGNMSISHMVQTLQYFQKHSAFEVSRQRDKVRRAKYSRSGFSTTGKESTGGMSASAVPGALLGPEQKAAAAAKNATAKLGVAGGPFALHGASAMVVGRHASMVDNKVAAKNGAKNGASPGMGSLRMPPTGYGSPRVVAGFVGMPPVQAQMQVTMQMPGPAVQAHGATQRSMRMGTHAAGNGGMIATKQLTQQQLGTKGVVGAAGPPGNLGSSPRLGAAG